MRKKTETLRSVFEKSAPYLNRYKQSIRMQFFRLLTYIKNYKPWVAGHIVSSLLMVFFSVASIPALIPFLSLLFGTTETVNVRPAEGVNSENFEAWINFYVSNLIETYGKETTLLYLCVGIILIFAGKNLFRYLALFFMSPVRNGIVRDIRQNLFRKTLSLPLAYFSEERKGDIMSRVTSDVQEIEWSILNVLETTIREPLLIIGALSFMFYVSPKLTFFVFGLLLFTGLIIGGIGKTLKKHSRDIQNLLGNLVSILEEALGGARIIKGFTAEKYQEAKFAEQNNAYRRTLTQMLWRRDLASPLTETLGVCTVAILIWYGFKQVNGGALSVATFFSFLYAFFTIIEPAKKFSSAAYNIQKGMAAVERVNEIMYAESSIVEKPNAAAVTEFQEKIVYKNVTFRYKNADRNALKKVNLTLQKGKITALVGASGAGKSTMADLLPRFYDVTEGAILLDGKDLRDYKIKDLRQLLGIVSQEAVLFNDTIYNNIVFGAKNVTQAQTEQAARIANAHNFILQTPDGYQTNIGDRGTKLSGGQRQRLTIARAVLKNPPILILDEATSALDSESEQLVQEALEKLMQNRTSLVIAHRLSTIKSADEIVVFVEGKIVERGTHEELLGREGIYKRLIEMQGS